MCERRRRNAGTCEGRHVWLQQAHLPVIARATARLDRRHVHQPVPTRQVDDGYPLSGLEGALLNLVQPQPRLGGECERADGHRQILAAPQDDEARSRPAWLRERHADCGLEWDLYIHVPAAAVAGMANLRVPPHSIVVKANARGHWGLELH